MNIDPVLALIIATVTVPAAVVFAQAARAAAQARLDEHAEQARAAGLEVRRTPRGCISVRDPRFDTLKQPQEARRVRAW